MLSRFTRQMPTVAKYFTYTRCFASKVKTDKDIMDEIQRALQKIDHTCEVTEDSKFVDDFGLDSLDVVELILEIEDKLNIEIPEEDAENINTVKDAIEYIKKQLKD